MDESKQYIAISTNNYKQKRLSCLIDNKFLCGAKQKKLCLTITVLPEIQAKLVDDLLNHGFDDVFVEFVMKKNSSLTFYLCLKRGLGQHICECCKCDISEDDSVVNKRIDLKFVGSGSQAVVKSVCFGGGKRSFKIKTLQHHCVEDSKSDVVIKSVLDEQSSIFCDNLIRVDKGASKTVARQICKSVLLSSEAHAISTPKLEIENDDVQCHHGAAVSRIDDEKMFYLQSKGIDVVAAKKMLIRAFLS